MFGQALSGKEGDIEADVPGPAQQVTLVGGLATCVNATFQGGPVLTAIAGRRPWALAADRMPQYYFHVRDGKEMPDTEGTALADSDAARAEAIVQERC